MRTYLVYRVSNGVPRRVLSLSNRVAGGGDARGTGAAGDMPGPKEFFQAGTFLSEAERPTPFPMTDKDMTPEVIAEKAAKYNMLPEDYYPLSMKSEGQVYGDYPDVVQEAYSNRNPDFEWDNPRIRRNYNTPLGIDEMADCGPFIQRYDGHFKYWGYYQWYEYQRAYFTYMFLMLAAPILAYYYIWPGVVKVKALFTGVHYDNTSINAHEHTKHNTSMILYNKLWSHSELEFRDVYLRMNQAKRGYPGYSDSFLMNRTYDSTGFYFGAHGNTSGRDRHGPTGIHPIRSEPQDIYMVPAGAMAFKQLAFQHEDETDAVADEEIATEAYKLTKKIHPHAGHCEMSTMYQVQTEVSLD